MKNRIKALASVMLVAVSVSACDLLDVNNPNNLVEESIRNTAAAQAVVNGAQALVAEAISYSWQPYLVASDEIYWIGSRDAWLSLDQGFISDPANEFTDAAFPPLAQARWMADEAVEIITEHGPGFETELARANLYAGIIHMIIGEVQEDFAFSDKTEDGPAVGPANMFQVLDDGIIHLDAAVANSSGDLRMQALAVRARAKFSRALWDKIKPSPNTGDPLAQSSSAAADALEVISLAGGVAADWDFDFHYSASASYNDIAAWINDRKENQIDQSLVNVDASNDITGVALMDPIDGIPDTGLTKRLEKWKGGPVNTKGGVYPPLTIASTRMMHLILAEDALAKGDDGGFATHINHVRAMDGETPYNGQIDGVEMLQHERRTNLTLMGVRLTDMYRFGITDPAWEPVSDAIQAPGTLLPITLVEVRSNCHLNGLGC
jgi:hypothetical protein